MIRSYRAELMKLRRPRVLYGALGALFGFTTLVTVLTFVTAKPAASTTPADRNSTLEQLAAAGGLTTGFTNASNLIGIVVVVVFLTSITTDHGLGTLRTLLLRQPRRDRFLAGKLLALLAAAEVALLLALVLSTTAATVVANARGLSTDAWFTASGLGSAATDFADTALAVACYGALGVAVGVLLRSTPLAVGATLGWFVMVENIANNTWADAAGWFPGLLVGVVSAGGSGTVSYAHAVAGALVYAVGALAVGTAVFMHRDVTA
jgi:ABC-2 type transport system permease protein